MKPAEVRFEAGTNDGILDPLRRQSIGTLRAAA